MAKEPWLIVVEGIGEAEFFNFLANDYNHDRLLPQHIALTFITAGGGTSPAKRILARAKQEKCNRRHSPYRHIFALLDSDRAFDGMAEDFKKENIILMTCNPRLENMLLACVGKKIPDTADAKAIFKETFGQEATELNWWNKETLPCNLTKEKLSTCPTLKPFWSIVFAKGDNKT